MIIYLILADLIMENINYLVIKWDDYCNYCILFHGWK